MSTATSTTEATSKDATAKSAPPQDAKAALQASVDEFLNAFKLLTPAQQTALDNLRTSVETVATGAKATTKDKDATPQNAKALLQASMEEFLGTFKMITPDQQIALNNLRSSVEAAITQAQASAAKTTTTEPTK